MKLKNSTNDTVPTKKVQELRKLNDDLQAELDRDKKRYSDLHGKYEKLEEDHVLSKAQLTNDKENLQSDLSTLKTRIKELEASTSQLKKEKIDLTKKFNDAKTKASDLESQHIRSSTLEYEKNRLKATLEEKEQELDRLKDENEMNKDVCTQMRKEVNALWFLWPFYFSFE